MHALESDRLSLQEVGFDDLPAIHHLHSFAEVDEYNTLGIPKAIEETKAYLSPLIAAREDENRKSYFWKILLKSSGEFIGIAGMTLSAEKFRRGEIYYKLLPLHWNKGYATELGKLLVNLGFKHFHLHRIEAGVATENIKSIKVLEKIGMQREGRHRAILPIRSEWKDNYHYAILDTDARSY